MPERAAQPVRDSTPHLYGCSWKNCRDIALTHLEWWEPGWGAASGTGGQPMTAGWAGLRAARYQRNDNLRGAE